MRRFEKKVVFITGGASGIGEATAERFAAEGATVVIADLDGELAKTVAGRLPGAYALTVDTSVPEQVERAIATTVERSGRIDVIFNNAGVSGEQHPIHETSLENWERVTRINGDGFFYVLKYGIAAMLRTGGGAIINNASISGLVGLPNIAPYTMTKWGVIGLTKSTAIEYAARGIRVNAVAPTVVRTPLVDRFIAESPDPKAMGEQMANYNPMPGMPESKDIAAAVAFLASDEARFITGHVLPIDGGYTAQ